MSLAASAYEAGQGAGTLVLLIVIALIGYSLLRRWLTKSFSPRFRVGLGVMTAVSIGLLAVIGFTGSAAIDPDAARAEMLAGCVNSAGEEGRSYCGCVVDEVMRRNGTSQDDLRRLEAVMRTTQEEGGPSPAVLTDSIDVCVRRAG